MPNTQHRYHRPTDHRHYALTVTETGVTHCYPTKGLLRSAERNLSDAGVSYTIGGC